MPAPPPPNLPPNLFISSNYFPCLSALYPASRFYNIVIIDNEILHGVPNFNIFLVAFPGNNANDKYKSMN
jgi:hypothetical protein